VKNDFHVQQGNNNKINYDTRLILDFLLFLLFTFSIKDKKNTSKFEKFIWANKVGFGYVTGPNG
jgi:hypothetical protein